MHGDDGCGCGHAHGEAMMETPVPTTASTEATETVQLEGGCGEGCGCGANATQMQGESCGSGDSCCGGGSEMARLEGAALQGFLSGLYASTMPPERLAEYLDLMAKQEGSEFAGPAKFLAGALQTIPADLVPEKSATVRLLSYISGEIIEG